jgi:hypothetical protein
MLWPRAVIWERYREYTAYPDYRDLRDRILDVPNYVGGYEEWLVRAELLVRERSALGTTEAHGGILAEEGRAEVSSPSDQHSLSDLRGIISTGPEEMTRSRRPPSWERRRNAGRGGRGFSAPSPHATLINGVETTSKILIISITTGTEDMTTQAPLITVPPTMARRTAIGEANVIHRIITTIDEITPQFRCQY